MTEKNKNLHHVQVNSESLNTCLPLDSKSIELDILSELGSIGAGHAATSLSELLQEKVSIDIPKTRVLLPYSLPKLYGVRDSPTTAIYMQLSEANCDILLLLEEDEAKKIAAIMALAPYTEESDPYMEVSAIHELANILIGSFLSAICNFIGLTVFLTPPQRLVDSFGGLTQFLIKQSLTSEEALVFDIRLKRASSDAKLMLMIFLGTQLRASLVQKSKELIDSNPEKSVEAKTICTIEAAAIADEASQLKINEDRV